MTGGALDDWNCSKTATPTYGCSLSIWPGGHCGRRKNTATPTFGCSLSVYRGAAVRVASASSTRRTQNNSFFIKTHFSTHFFVVIPIVIALPYVFFEKTNTKKHSKKKQKKNFNFAIHLLAVALDVEPNFYRQRPFASCQFCSLCSTTFAVFCVFFSVF